MPHIHHLKQSAAFFPYAQRSQLRRRAVFVESQQTQHFFLFSRRRRHLLPSPFRPFARRAPPPPLPHSRAHSACTRSGNVRVVRLKTLCMQASRRAQQHTTRTTGVSDTFLLFWPRAALSLLALSLSLPLTANSMMRTAAALCVVALVATAAAQKSKAALDGVFCFRVFPRCEKDARPHTHTHTNEHI